MRMLEGKIIVITGGSQGLGEGVARRAVEAGAAGLVICARSVARGEATAAALTDLGCPTHFVPADLANVDDCRAVIHACDRLFGHIDGLVNCAASTERGSVEDTTVELFDRIFAINVRAPLFLMQETVRLMKRDGIGGSIVNIGSINAHGGQPNLTTYSASKGALATLSKNAAHALGPHHIRVNCINVGWMSTPNEHVIQKAEGKPDNWLEAADASAPFGRILRPADVASLVTWLLSDEAVMFSGSVV
ncbi:MAG: SDR family oxidoreductase, partial [Caldilineaceae bacterium]|nr:SDR family oxidoreductase [Caldilineaceae bacterium]